MFKKYLSIFIVLCMSSTSIYGLAAGQSSKVTINGKNLSIISILSSIKKQTGKKIKINVDSDLINKKDVTINFVNADLDEVIKYLNNILSSFYLKHTNNTILLNSLENTTVRIDSIPQMVSGWVKDNQGNAIPGATIKIKNSIKGTTTDDNGKFTLANVSTGSKLIISSVGYQTKELIATERNIVTELYPFVNNLNETQIIAYGTRTKRLNTGNVSTLKASQIQDMPVSNPLLAIQGRLPGVEITPANGLPGAGIKVRVQGTNSILNGSDPLIIIDNVPFPSQSIAFGPYANDAVSTILGTSGGSSTQLGNPLSFLSSGDIESIDVLKGADATSIYGSRAANGAILITTRRGKGGSKTSVTVNIQAGFTEVGRKLKLLNSSEYLNMRREALKNEGIAVGPRDYDLNGFYDTSIVHDWQKELVGNKAFNSIASLNIGGGTDLISYQLSGTYMRNNTVYPEYFHPLHNDQASLATNISGSSPNKRFKFNFSSYYTYGSNKLPTLDYMSPALSLLPVGVNLLTPDGKLNWLPNSSGTETWNNPIVNSVKTYERTTNVILESLSLSFEILPGLKLSSNFGYNKNIIEDIGTTPLAALSPSQISLGQQSQLKIQTGTSTSINIEPMLTYYKTFKKSTIEALIGGTINRSSQIFRGYVGQGFSTDLLIKDIQSANSIIGVLTNESIYKYFAGFGRVNYNFDGKYIIQLTGRRDGSSRFGPDNRYHSFGSIGGAWIFSEEQAIKEKLPWLFFGKLRGSYGTSGNDQIGDYTYLTLYAPIPTSRPYQGVIGLSPSALTNSSLQWEEVKKLEVGLDVGFLENRISVNANYAQNRSSNQLLPLTLPSISGFSSVYVNFPAKVQNKSWELTLNTINIKKPNLSWSTTATLTIPKNKLLSFPGLEESPFSNTYEVGQPVVGFQKIFKTAGINDTTGVFQFYDSKGNITSNPDYIKDAIHPGVAISKLNGALVNTISYNNFSFSILFTFNKGTVLTPAITPMPGTFGKNFPHYYLNRWQKPGDKAEYQKYSIYSNYTPYYYYLALGDNAYINQYYLRCGNISLYYEIPSKLRKNLSMQACNIYAQIMNPFVITNNKKVLDPETSNSLPPLKAFNIGIKATF